MRISLIIPAYNEEVRLPPFLGSIATYVTRRPDDIFEVLVVDDGSQDRTVSRARSFSTRLPRFRVIELGVNQGKGAAVRAGIMNAGGDAAVFMDADGATGIDELPKMITALDKFDIGIGNRWMRGSKTRRHSLLRRLSGWANRSYMRLFGLGSIDTMCGFKGYRISAARDLFGDLLEKRWLFDTEVAYKAVRNGYKIQNFPINWESMDGSKLSTFTLIKSGWQIWPLIRRINRRGSHRR